MFAITSLLVALFTLPLNFLVDFMFEVIINAPTPESLHSGGTNSAVLKKGQDAIRRVSISINEAIIPLFSSNNVIKGRFGQMRTTKVISKEILEAHRVTQVMGTDLKEKLRFLNSKYRLQQEPPEQASSGNNDKCSVASVDSKDFSDNMLCQRASVSPHSLDVFDRAWKIALNDPRSTQAAVTLWREKIARIDVLAANELSNLSLASPAEAGLTILQQFVVDLLGRHTRAATIYMTKSGLE